MWERIYLVGAWEQPLVPYWRRGSFTPKSISEQVKPIKVPRRRGNVLYNRSSQFTVPRRGSPSWTLRPRLSRSSPPRASLLLSLLFLSSRSSFSLLSFAFSPCPSSPPFLPCLFPLPLLHLSPCFPSLPFLPHFSLSFTSPLSHPSLFSPSLPSFSLCSLSSLSPRPISLLPLSSPSLPLKTFRTSRR